MLNGRKLLLVSCVLACGWSTTQAEDRGLYIGAGIGTSNVEVHDGPFFQTHDDWIGSWSATAGYRLNSWFAVEAGYADLGTAKTRSDTSLPGIFDVTSKLKVDGYTAAAVGFLPLSSAFDLHARVGVLFSEADIRIRFPETGFRQRETGKDEDLFYGVGLGWRATQNWSLSLDYTRYQDVGEDHEIPGERDIESIGIYGFYKF